MDELFPVLGGVLLGFVVARMKSRPLGSVVLVIASLVLGSLASWISGELAVSVWYVLIDFAQVLAAAILISVLPKVWSRRIKRFT